MRVGHILPVSARLKGLCTVRQKHRHRLGVQRRGGAGSRDFSWSAVLGLP